MAYVPVPKDLTKVKTKVMFNLTKRQLVCFGSGALLGVPLFFLLKGPVGTSTAAMCMVVLMLPFFLLAMYEKNGQPLEKILRNMIRVCFLRPRQRPYKTKNFYAVIMRQNQLDREVYHIVNGKAKTDPRREKAGRSRHDFQILGILAAVKHFPDACLDLFTQFFQAFLVGGLISHESSAPFLKK